MKYRFVLSLLCVLFIVNTAHAGSSDYRYALFDLGDFGGDASNAFGINDAGIVVGNAWFPGNGIYHATAFVHGKVYDLGTIGGDISFARKINNQNEIAIVSKDINNDYRAVLWKSGELIDLGTLGGSEAGARSISDSGDIVGWSFLESDTISHAFRWLDGTMTDLDSLMGAEGESVPWDINEAGQIVGYSSSDHSWNAVLWQPDNELIELPSLCEGCKSKAYAINDLGYTVGWSETAFGGKVASLWDEQNDIYNLATGRSDILESEAWGINNQSQVVGFSKIRGSPNHGVGMIFEETKGIQFLDDLAPPNLDMTIYIGYDINEHGQIAGWGETRKSHYFRAILLTPVESEFKLSDPSPGIAGQTNTWIVTKATPFADITLAYSHKGGGAVIPGCDTLDAVIQMDKPKIIQTVTADADGVARFEIFVVNQASNFANGILFQAASVGECEESQLKLFVFE